MSDQCRFSTATDTITFGTISCHEQDMKEEKSDEPPPSRLDGGLEAWLTITGAWMVQFCTFGYTNAFGVYQDYYTRNFLKNTTASDISWIGSFQLFMLYSPGILVGRAFDSGYFHLIMISGSSLYIFSMFMVSLTQPGQYYQVFLSQAVGMGIGQGMIFLPTLTIVSHHFQRQRALAVGIVVSGASCGGIVFPIMLNQLAQRTTFANSIRISAGLVTLMLVVANLIMKTRLPPKKDRPALPPFDVKVVLTDVAYWLSIAAAFCINLGLFFPYFYMQLYSVEHGVNSRVAFYSLAIINAGSLLGRILTSFIADHLNIYNVLIPCVLSSAILLFIILALKTFAGIVIVGILYGFSSGAYVSLVPSLLNQLSTHVGELGIRMGIAFSVVGIAMLVGTPIEGALLGSGSIENYVWWRTIVFSGILVMIGAVLMTISRGVFIRRRACGQLE